MQICINCKQEFDRPQPKPFDVPGICDNCVTEIRRKARTDVRKPSKKR